MASINTPAVAPAYSRGQESARGEVATFFHFLLEALIFNITHITIK